MNLGWDEGMKSGSEESGKECGMTADGDQNTLCARMQISND